MKQVGEDQEAICEIESHIGDAEQFRFSGPVRSRSGTWVEQGLCAKRFVIGRHENGRFDEQILACKAFHESISHFARPALFDSPGEKNAWQVADEVTWGELETDQLPRIRPVVEKLRDVLRPVKARSQLIHGDFGGNLIYADGLAPAVLDFSPYWRPAGFALGVVVVDAMVWDDADESLIDAVTDVDEWLQLLARAELRRFLEIDTHWARGRNMLDQIDAHLPTVEAICRRCRME